jgi:hypothetical protein
MLSGNKLDVDAGFYRCVPVGDLVWYDINKNDIWNTNENGINNIEVRLWRNHFGSWLLWNVAYTGPKPGSPSDDGYFNFCAPPGQYYCEVIMPPLGLVRAKPNVGNNEEIDSDLTNAFGNATSDVFNLVSGTSKQDFGAGFYPMAVAGNLVWRDDNLNGVQDVGEGKVSGVKVEAYDATSGQKLAETVTNSDGVYKIDYLEKRDIYMKFTPPAGFGATYPRMSADDVDSDVDHTYGLYTTRMFSMQSGVNNPNIDMGLAFGVLPVDWVDVSVSNVSNGHLVSWITAREVNVSHYIVERKLDIEKDFKVISVNIPSLGIRSGNSQ